MVLYLNLVVLFISLNNLQAWLIEVGYSSDLFYIKNMLVPWYFFILPMFYAFIIHFLEVDKTIIGFVKFAIVGYADGDDTGGFLSLSKEAKSVILGTFFGLCGTVIGAVMGTSRKKFHINGSNDTYRKELPILQQYDLLQD